MNRNEDCAFVTTVSAGVAAVDLVADAMPRLVVEGEAVRIEEHQGAMRLVARDRRDVVEVGVAASFATGAMAVSLDAVRTAVAELVEEVGSGPNADQLAFATLGGEASVSVGGREKRVAPRALSDVEGVAGTFPVIGVVAPGELLAVAERALASGGRLELGVDIEDGAFAFSAHDVVARVDVTQPERLKGLDEAFCLGAGRVAAVVGHLGDAPIEVRFGLVDDGAFVALVSGGVVVCLHARRIEG